MVRKASIKGINVWLQYYLRGLEELSPLIQILLRPMQVGKTTVVLKLLQKWDDPIVYGLADTSTALGPAWVERM